MILRSGAETLRRRPRKFPPWLLDRGARVVIESGRPIARTVPVPAGGSAPAVAGLVDQRRRERRLIQKAPADSAARTPIHPAKRSSEDRCIVSGSSIDDEGNSTVRGRTGGASLSGHPRARGGRLLHGPLGGNRGAGPAAVARQPAADRQATFGREGDALE